MNKGIIGYSLDSIRYYLNRSEKRRAVIMFVLLLVTSFLDVIGLASLVPVMVVAAEPGGVQKSKFFAPIYHGMNFESERSFLLMLIVAVFVFFLVKNLFSTWVNYLQTDFTTKLGLNIVKTQLDKYLHFPFWDFNHLGSSNLINSALEVPRYYVSMVVRPLFVLFSELAVVVVIVISILIYKPLLLALLAFVLVPTTLLTYRALRARSQAIGNRVNELRPISYGIIGDLFTGFVELKLANKQYRFRDRLLENQRELQTLDSESYLYSLLPLKVIEMVAILGVLTIFLYAIFVPSASNSLIALVGLFAAAAYRLMPSVNRMLTALMQVKQAQSSIENLETYREPKYNERPDPKQLPLSFEHSLAFSNVTFSFPGVETPTLRSINLEIRKGEKIGFIGSSGSGKTTLMNVLLRFYVEQHGHILIDGQPLTSQHIEAWHRIVGYVKQDTFLMEASIQDNITLGDANVDAARLDYAIEQASLRNFIAGLPEGVNTHIGERGSKLSGGQRQRIGIARALYKRTQVLVLDEATSALDNETEREVNEAINKLSETDITILIIAHRITTLRECDRIYELSQGNVIAEHQYESLMQQIVQA
ncbi:ABC transporter ATP-binding protein [Hymenobacter negativus]|nr:MULTISPECIES: ABC transporter ATP-binding protein [Bacteria]MBH8567835.1 ABC transporter ATP-binding protein [Hymenobacter negativus]MBR7207571.1 ABC transporter ATP-binding protein [Microvirga sp. STS02]